MHGNALRKRLLKDFPLQDVSTDVLQAHLIFKNKSLFNLRWFQTECVDVSVDKMSTGTVFSIALYRAWSTEGVQLMFVE